MASSDEADIRRRGIMKKLKTMKKKYFVLREDSKTGPARLEYYDTEKKYRSGGHPKRSIHLKTCLNINKKFDTKHKCAIVLFTKDDCFSVVAENEEEQEFWLLAMRELLVQTTNDGEVPKPAFEHVWQLTVKPRGLGSSKNLTGHYRLCLTDRDVALVKVNHELPAIVFQLPSIRRCGHSDCFFFMEVGRSAPTGAGELWMQVEDTVIAQNMHEAILSSMKAMNALAEMPSIPRPRSHTTSSRDGTKPVPVPHRGTPAPQDSQGPKRSRTISEGTYPSPRRPRISPSRKHSNASDKSRPNSMYGRSTSVPMGVQAHSPVAPPTASMYSRSMSVPMGVPVHSPVAPSTSSSEIYPGHRSRSDSTDSHGTGSSSISMDDSDMEHLSSGHLSSHSHSTTPEHPILEEKEDYFSMGPYSGSHSSWKDPIREMGRVGEGYMDMSLSTSQTSHSSLGASPCTDGKDNYLDMSMSPVSSKGEELPYMDMSKSTPGGVGKGTSGETPGVKSEEDSGYLDMHPVGQSLPTVREKAVRDGYLDMRVPSSSSSSGQSPLSLPPEPMKMDKVLSYLQDDPSLESFPKRAYSLGSRAQIVARSVPKNQSYMEMVARQGPLDKAEGKSSSAPHLTAAQSKQQSSRSHSSRGSSASGSRDQSQESIPGKVKTEEQEKPGVIPGKDNPDLFMEMDFTRPRTASDSHGYRPRTGSFSSREMRPRSSSHGHRSNLKANLKSQSSSRASSQGEISRKSSKESLSRSQESSLKGSRDSLKKTSHESLSKVSQNSDYLDMSPRLSTSPSALMAKALKKEKMHTKPLVTSAVIAKATASHVVRPKPNSNYMSMGFDDSPKKSDAVGSSRNSGGGGSIKKDLSGYASMAFSQLEFSPHDPQKPPFPEVSGHVRSPSAPVERIESNYMAMDDVGKVVQSSGGQSSKMECQKVASHITKVTNQGAQTGATSGFSSSSSSSKLTNQSGGSGKKSHSHSLDIKVTKVKSQPSPSPLTSTPKTTSKPPSSFSSPSSSSSFSSSPALRPASPISPVATTTDIKQSRVAPPSTKPMKPLPVLPTKPVGGATRHKEADNKKALKNSSASIVSHKCESKAGVGGSHPVIPGQFDDAPIDSYMLYTPGTDGSKDSQTVAPSSSLAKQQSYVSAAAKHAATPKKVTPHEYMNVKLDPGKDLHGSGAEKLKMSDGRKRTGSSSDVAIMAVVQPTSPNPVSPKTSGLTPKLPMPKRGSTSSVSSFTEGVTGAGSGKEAGGSSGLTIAAHSNPNIFKPGERRSLTEVSPYENITFKFPHSGATVACSSETELNYASLDLQTSDDPEGGTPRSPRLNKSRNSSGGNEDEAPLLYAEIDFAKSEGLRNTSTSHREHRLSLDALTK